jgi:hypothetical protein
VLEWGLRRIFSAALLHADVVYIASPAFGFTRLPRPRLPRRRCALFVGRGFR